MGTICFDTYKPKTSSPCKRLIPFRLFNKLSEQRPKEGCFETNNPDLKDMIDFWIFPTDPANTTASIILLALRVVFGALLLRHGIEKCLNYKTLSTTFLDPLHIGAKRSLQLAIFGEAVCTLGVISGLLFRLACIACIATMAVATFGAMRHATFSQKELPFVYLLMFILLFIMGPGIYSLDSLI